MSSEPPSSTGVLVSIVIVNFNTRALLERCLDSVAADSPSLGRQVIVVDNASTDGSADSVAGQWPQATLIRNRENFGYAPACNQGLRAARSRYLLALNSDAFPRGRALTRLVDFMEVNPDVAAVGPRLLNRDGSLQTTCARRDPTWLSIFFQTSGLVRWFPFVRAYAMRIYQPSFYERVQDVPVLSGACMLYRAEALERVGLLDDRLKLNYDDVEWSQRARRMGWRLAYLPDAEVLHLGGQTRMLDPATSTLPTVRSDFTYFDLVFRTLAAFPIKLGYIGNLSLSLAKHLVLAPFHTQRRRRLAELIRLMIACTALLPRRARRIDVAGSSA